MKAVQEIFQDIAVDLPIAIVNFLIHSFTKVANWKRKQKEDLNYFVSRFHGLAAEHMMQTGALQSCSIGEVIAIKL